MLPHEQLPLHIFEARYQELFQELEEKGGRFGLPFIEKEASMFVSICKLNEVTKRLPNGERNVLIECVDMAKLSRLDDQMPGKSYPGGELGVQIPFDISTRASNEMLELFADYIELRFGKRPSFSEIKHYSLMDVAACLALSNENKIKFIKAANQKAQSDMLFGLIKYLQFLFYQESKKENGIILN